MKSSVQNLKKDAVAEPMMMQITSRFMLG